MPNSSLERTGSVLVEVTFADLAGWRKAIVASGLRRPRESPNDAAIATTQAIKHEQEQKPHRFH